MEFLAARAPYPGLTYLFEDLGLAQVMGALRRQGHQCRLHDGVQAGAGAGEFVTAMVQAPEEVILASIHAEQCADYLLRLWGEVKRLAPAKRIVLGGHPVACIDQAVARLYPQAVDYLVRGEGEETVAELAAHLETGRPELREIAGLSYWSEGRLITNPARPRMADYATLAPAARDAWREEGARPLSNSALVQFSRGCDHACSFCTVAAYHGAHQRRWQSRPLESFVEELAQLASRLGIGDFTIIDPNFLGSPRQVDEQVAGFARALQQAGLDIIFDMAVRVDALTPQRLDVLHGSGLRRVLLGVESGSEEQLRAWKKGLAPADSRRAMGWLVERGIFVEVAFIMLGPLTTLPQIGRNLDFLETLPYFSYYCYDRPLWPFHVSDKTYNLDQALLEPAQGRIYRRYNFRDSRVAQYAAMCATLARGLGPPLDAIKTTMLWHMPALPQAIHLFAQYNRQLLSLYSQAVRRGLELIKGGATEEAVRESAGQCVAGLEEHFYSKAREYSHALAASMPTGAPGDTV